MWDDLLVEFKKFLEINDDSSDDFLTEILKIAESYIFNHYSIAIVERDLVERIKKIYNGIIYTKRGIITDLIEINLDGEDLAQTDLLEFEYELNKIYPPIGFDLTQYQKIKIEYKVGYNSIDFVPNGLLSGLMLLGKKVYLDATKDTDNIIQMSTGVKESVKVIDDVPPMVANLLESFRVFRL